MPSNLAGRRKLTSRACSDTREGVAASNIGCLHLHFRPISLTCHELQLPISPHIMARGSGIQHEAACALCAASLCACHRPRVRATLPLLSPRLLVSAIHIQLYTNQQDFSGSTRRLPLDDQVRLEAHH